MNHVFISCVTDEYKGYRQKLAKGLRSFHTVIQQDFPQATVNTIDKLYWHVSQARFVLHFFGRSLGSRAAKSEVDDFLKTSDGRRFKQHLDHNFSDINLCELAYIQWEVLIANFLHKEILVYKQPFLFKDAAEEEQVREHDRLLLRFSPERRAEEFSSFSQLQVRSMEALYEARLRYRYDPPKAPLAGMHRIHEPCEVDHRGMVDVLKWLLESNGQKLLKDRLLLFLYVQITKEFPKVVPSGWLEDIQLLDSLAEREKAQNLLGCVLLCVQRAKKLRLKELARKLEDWFDKALAAINETVSPGLVEAGILGANSGVSSRLKDGVPALCLEIALRPQANELTVGPRFESYIRWGDYRAKASFSDDFKISLEEAPTRLVQQIKLDQLTRNIPFDRLEVFVSKDQLMNTWEFRFDSASRQYTRHPLSYPTVVRLLDRIDDVIPPPTKIQSSAIVCFWQAWDDFIDEVCNCGAFFFGFPPEAPPEDADLVHVAVNYVGIGLWLRASHSLDALQQMLASFDDMAVSELPKSVHERRKEACRSKKSSAWHDLTLLFDYERTSWGFFESLDDEQQFARTNYIL